jgi:hypothetical protein
MLLKINIPMFQDITDKKKATPDGVGVACFVSNFLLMFRGLFHIM